MHNRIGITQLVTFMRCYKEVSMYFKAYLVWRFTMGLRTAIVAKVQFGILWFVSYLLLMTLLIDDVQR